MPEVTQQLSVDIETFSEVDLPKCGVYKYAEHPSFEVLMLAYKFEGEEAGMFDLTRFTPCDLIKLHHVVHALYNPAIRKTAWNSQFEWVCLSEWLQRNQDGLKELQAGFGSPRGRLDPAQWRCTMTNALMIGLPGALDAANTAIGIDKQFHKHAAGRALIKYFSMPVKPTKANGMRTRNFPRHDPDKWQVYLDYGKQDVVAEVEMLRLISQFPIDEREWDRHTRDILVNDRGVTIDMDLVDSAIALAEAESQKALARAKELTGLDNPNSVEQLKNWLEREIGEEITSLTKKDLPVIAQKTSDEGVKEVIQLRKKLSLASVKKYHAMKRAVCKDGKLRGMFQFYGANRTGREAGRIVQLQNLKTNDLPDLDLARQLVKARASMAIEMLFGSIPAVLSQCVRTALIPGEGKVFVVVDESAIEARKLAWAAWEPWRIEVFNTHGLIYEASASKMFNVPMEDFLAYAKEGKRHPLRKKGKIAELALGYAGAAGAMITMGALDQGLKLEELDPIVDVWRKRNPYIASFDNEQPGFWKRLEKIAHYAMRNPGRRSEMKIGDPKQPAKIAYELITHGERRALYCWLPSGRPIVYWNPRLEKAGKFDRVGITYEGYHHKTGHWTRLDTYYGKLAENWDQASSRDVLFHIIDQAHEDLEVHVHDEGVWSVPEAEAPAFKARIEALMSTPIQWAPGLPLRGEGSILPYYRKEE